MSKSFDDLFNEFFNEGQDKNRKKNHNDDFDFGAFGKEIDPNNLPEDMPPMIKNIIQALNNGFEDVTGQKGPMFPKDIEDVNDNLGDPDSEETSTDGDSTFNKKTWDTDFGSVTRISISGPMPPDGLDGDSMRDMINNMFKGGMGIPFGSRPKRGVSLEDQLEVALAKDSVEGYEEAARLRIEIEKRDKKNKTTEKPENTDEDDLDDWPF